MRYSLRHAANVQVQRRLSEDGKRQPTGRTLAACRASRASTSPGAVLHIGRRGNDREPNSRL